MRFAYNFGVFLYKTATQLASLGNEKASKRIKGVRESIEQIRKLDYKEKTWWFHCASLGEFEQGRPVIEAVKKFRPDLKIILTFFSPSGYEIRKNYKGADAVFYLPDDSRKNARLCVEKFNPERVFFVKYEFWYWYLKTLKTAEIPVYLVSGIFRETGIFFKPWGGFFRKILQNFEYFFLQDNRSQYLLEKIGFSNTSVSGDTRYDRVLSIADEARRFPIIDSFTKDRFVVVAGSTWEPDDELFIKYFESAPENTGFIIVPHEIKHNKISEFIEKSALKALRFSESEIQNMLDYRILIIDNIGMLSSLYAYAHVAYVGGGFGTGIHNTLEAAVYGIPVIFGPKYQKFNEAVELVRENAGVSVDGFEKFKKILDRLIIDQEARSFSGNQAKEIVARNSGASSKILGKLGFDSSELKHI